MRKLCLCDSKIHVFLSGFTVFLIFIKWVSATFRKLGVVFLNAKKIAQH